MARQRAALYHFVRYSVLDASFIQAVLLQATPGSN